MTGPPIRIAMWSGPRNLSTALMRSFGARSDTHCVDEPFYASYLKLTGYMHPMRAEILSQHETDADIVAQRLSRAPLTADIQYQKHMTHHMVQGIPRDWFGAVRHAFLIRHPARVLASYAKKMETVSLTAIGFPQQLELYEQARTIAPSAPVIIDSDTLLSDPASELKRLCERLQINFDPAMLGWAPGPKPEDGAWAPHWYDAVYNSNGFADPPGAVPNIPSELTHVLEPALDIYHKLRSQI